jgi:pimeloyl-ACP methyl ester carboxylesterase
MSLRVDRLPPPALAILAVPPLLILVLLLVWVSLPPRLLGPPPAGTARLVADACWFNEGWLRRTRCGWLYPSLRGNAEDAAALPVVALQRHLLSGPSRRATVYLTGGPGGNSYLSAVGVEHWRGWIGELGLDHDLILYDQRGSGASWPRLDCRALAEVERRLLGSDADLDSRWLAFEQVLLQCAAQLPADDIATGLYSTESAAQDLRELLQALRRDWGYREISVYGVSYGTRLAIEALAENPGLADAVVLDSLYPAGVDLDLGFADSFAAILDRVDRRCAALQVCADGEPTLRQRLDRALGLLEAAPVLVTVEDYWSDSMLPVRIDPSVLINLIEHVLYVDLDVDTLSLRLSEAAEGNYGEAWQEIVAEWLVTMLDPEFSVVAQVLIECRDNAPIDADDEAAVLARHPPWRQALQRPAAAFDLCPRLGVVAQPLQPRTLPQPTLVLAADLDPRTPADLTLPAVAGFRQLQQLRRPIGGHSVVDYDGCAAAAAGVFLNTGGRSQLLPCKDGATAD